MTRKITEKDRNFDDEPLENSGRELAGELLSDQERDLLIKRLTACGLPTQEIVRITGASGRTVARSMQRLGLKRKKPERCSSSRKRHDQRLIEILTQYYALHELTLDSLDQLTCENGLTLRKLLNLIQEHVSPSRWAIRPCLSCSQPALTSSPSDRYCPTCKKKVKKVREGMDDAEIYE